MATTITKTETLVGKRIRRREDPRLITGTATYVDDIQMPGMHHACIVRSPHGAAKIKSIDIEGRRSNIPAWPPCSPAKTRRTSGRCPAALRCPACACRIIIILAIDRVYFVGPSGGRGGGDRPLHRARRGRSDRSGLRAAAGRRRSRESASRPARRAVHPEWPDNIAFTYHQEGGDVDKAFAEAEVVVKQRITSQRLIPTAMETRGVVAEWHAGDKAHDPLLLHADSAPAAHAGGADAGHAGESAARGHARSGRRLRQQAERVRRRGADGLRRHEDRQAGEVDRIAPREFHVHHPRPRPRGLLRSRRQARRHHPGHQAEADPGPGRVSSVADARHPDAFAC